jgi:hypothetical protein
MNKFLYRLAHLTLRIHQSLKRATGPNITDVLTDLLYLQKRPRSMIIGGDRLTPNCGSGAGATITSPQQARTAAIAVYCHPVSERFGVKGR